ncbi:MAG: serine/threonine-protein phosphatase, partial [Aquificota bacterium]
VYGIEVDRVIRLTQDHTEAEELVKAGFLDPRRAKHDPRRNFLTSAIIGSPDFKDFEVFTKEVYDYRHYLICSDGVWEPLEEEELLLPPDNMVEALLQKGGDDNMSFINIRVEV